jgi:hypothetical protein
MEAGCPSIESAMSGDSIGTILSYIDKHDGHDGQSK